LRSIVGPCKTDHGLSRGRAKGGEREGSRYLKQEWENGKGHEEDEKDWSCANRPFALFLPVWLLPVSMWCLERCSYLCFSAGVWLCLCALGIRLQPCCCLDVGQEHHRTSWL